jgi:tetratricopeptide (TPR) repeat protein
MPRVNGKVDDMAAAPDGTVVSHRWLGANTAIPAYYGYDEQLRQIIEYLRDDKLKIDIFSLDQNDAPTDSTPAPHIQHPDDPRKLLPISSEAPNLPAKSDRRVDAQSFLAGIVAPIDQSSFDLAPGKPVTVSAVITNSGIGHSLVPEQRDFYESWVEFLVTDQAGRVIYQSGAIQPNGDVDPEAHTYTNRIINRQDDFLDKHQVWSAMVRAYDNTILPGRSDLARYRFHIPSGATELNIAVRVKYRRFRRAFSDWVFSEPSSAPDRYPTVVMAEKTLRLRVGHNTAQPPSQASATALRWNNYGIALLDQQQLGAAAEVFEHEAAIDPSQPDGNLNAGVALYMDGDYDRALRKLAAAERTDPGSPRIAWYQGLCYRWQFRYDLAIEKMMSVEEQFPRFRQVHDDLGYIYTVQRRYPAARHEYETAQSIDPDDLTAHRWLATVYLKLGMKAEAERETALTSVEKEDPVAGWEVQRYWQKNPGIAREIVPYHVHTDDPADIRRQAQRVNDLQNDPSLLWFLQ